MRRFGDFAQEIALSGDKICIDKVLNQEICVIGFVEKQSKHKTKDNDLYCTVQFYFLDNELEKFVFFTGSVVIKNQLEKYKDNLPFITTVKKINKYFTFT